MRTKLSHLTDPSLSNVFRVALPLILQSASGTTMYFLDRLVLAQYSERALLAAASASSICVIFQFGLMALTNISQVLVGQHYGAKQDQQIGQPVWQMLWICIFFTGIALCLGQFTGPIFIQTQYLQDGLPYYQWCMSFSSLIPMLGALTGFFTGQGLTQIIVWNTIIGNLINLILDIVLVFGYLPNLEPLGATGAALATVISQLFQVAMLFYIFLNAQNRQRFKTNHFQINPTLMWKCIKIGGPNAISHMLEFSAWALLIYLLGDVSEQHLFVFTLGNSIWILFSFVADGVQRTTTAYTSNIIGSCLTERINQLVSYSIFIFTIWISLAAIPTFLAPELLLNLFTTGDQLLLTHPDLLYQMTMGLRWTWLLLAIDGFTWIYAGTLIAGGDTRFIMLTNVSTSWLLCIVPFYYLTTLENFQPYFTFVLPCLYTFSNSVIFYIRYHKTDWKQLNLTLNSAV